MIVPNVPNKYSTPTSHFKIIFRKLQNHDSLLCFSHVIVRLSTATFGLFENFGSLIPGKGYICVWQGFLNFYLNRKIRKPFTQIPLIRIQKFECQIITRIVY